MDALFLLWQATVGLPQKARAEIRERIVDAAREAKSWKSGETLRDLALMSGKDEPEVAAAIVAAMPEDRSRRQAEARLAKSDYLPPRPFFWDSKDAE
jgi:hypothetical protein